MCSVTYLDTPVIGYSGANINSCLSNPNPNMYVLAYCASHQSELELQYEHVKITSIAESYILFAHLSIQYPLLEL